MAVMNAQSEEKPEAPPHAPAHGLVQPPTLVANISNDVRKVPRPASMVMRAPVAALVAPQTS